MLVPLLVASQTYAIRGGRISTMVLAVKIAFMHPWTSYGKEATGRFFVLWLGLFPPTWAALSLCLVCFFLILLCTNLKRTYVPEMKIDSRLAVVSGWLELPVTRCYDVV